MGRRLDEPLQTRAKTPSASIVFRYEAAFLDPVAEFLRQRDSRLSVDHVTPVLDDFVAPACSSHAGSYGTFG